MKDISEIIETITQLNREVVKLAEAGDLEASISIAQEAVSYAIKLGQENIDEHPAFADSLNNLAELYRMQGYFVEAKPLYIKILNLRKRLLGDSHPDVAQSLNNLAAFYVSQGLFVEAENYFLAALDIWKIHLGDEHPEIATNLNNIAEVYREQGRFQESEKTHLQALNMRKRLFGDFHADIAQSLDNLAVIYENQARYSEAETTHLEALEIRREIFGDKNWQIAASLNNLAALYNSQGRFAEAAENYSQALELCKNCLVNEEHPYIAITLNNLANTYKNQGHYADAEKTHLQALSMRKKIFGYEHLEVAQSLSNLGDIYLIQGRYLDAEEAYLEADLIRKNSLNSEHPDIALNLHNLGVLYTYQGRYQQAEAKYLEALSLHEQSLGKNHPIVADNLNHLGSLYQEQGLFSDAEQKYLAALAIRKNIFGEEHPDIADSYNKIAEIYRLQGRYSQAEGLYIEAYKLNKKLLGEMHPDVAAILSNLGVLYDAQFKYSQAEPLLTEALLIVRTKFGDNHPQVASVLNNLAAIYGSMRNYLKAEEIHLQVLEIRKTIFGSEHPDIANTLNNLAEIYLAQGKYAEAEKYYSSALSVRMKFLGENHPDVALSLNNLATLYAATKRPDDALSYRIQASAIHDKLISNVFAFSSENDRLAFIDKIRGNFDLFLSLIYQYFPNSETATQEAFDFILKRKGLTAASLAAQSQAFYSDRYPQLTGKFRQLSELNTQLVRLTSFANQTKNIANYQSNLTQLRSQYDNLQKQIASQVPEIQLSTQIPNRHAVASALPSKSVLIEFVLFDVFDFQAIPANGETQWQSPHYLAFILPAGQPDAVKMVDLGEADTIDNLINLFRLEASDGREETLGWAKVKTTPQLQIKQYNPAAAVELSQIILSPILDVLPDCDQIIFAPDGNLNLVPLQILPVCPSERSFLMDKYTVSYLGVGRDIIHSQHQPTTIGDTPIIIADPDFDLAMANNNLPNSQNPTKQELLHTLDIKLEIKTLPPAHGTRLLGASVAKKLKNARLYTGEKALATCLTNSKCPSIMLIATHGLFISDSQQSNPMMRSAVAFAGANTALLGGNLPKQAGNGFIFAQDIAGLDLRANELTVLSACDTARGDIKIGEGVFGLRRAFASSGTKILVMSLWEVPGRATALLMEQFFEHYQSGVAAVEALQNAQNYIRDITVEELRKSDLGMEILTELSQVRGLEISTNGNKKPLEHPFYWGAWICQGL